MISHAFANLCMSTFLICIVVSKEDHFILKQYNTMNYKICLVDLIKNVIYAFNC